MSELGPLPEAAHHSNGPFGLSVVPLYTADQMRSYAQQEVEKERERCAKVCEGFGGNGPNFIDDDWAAMCAAAIRGPHAIGNAARGDGEPGCRDCADNNGTCPHDGHKCGA